MRSKPSKHSFLLVSHLPIPNLGSLEVSFSLYPPFFLITANCFSVSLRFMFISVPCHCLELLPLPLLPCPLAFSGTWLCLSSLIPASPASVDSFPSTSLVYTSDQPLSALLAPDKLLERISPHSMCLHPYHLPLWILGIWFQHWPF